MLDQSTIDEIHSKISDFHTLNVSAYDPAGLESLDTYVSPACLITLCYV
jgi:gamma-glutamyltranspeptidase/glutathione hydrolase